MNVLNEVEYKGSILLGDRFASMRIISWKAKETPCNILLIQVEKAVPSAISVCVNVIRKSM